MEDKMSNTWALSIWVPKYCFLNFKETFTKEWIYCRYNDFITQFNEKKEELVSLKSQIITSMIWIKKHLLINNRAVDEIVLCWPWKTYDKITNTCIISPIEYWNDWTYLYAKTCTNNTSEHATVIMYTETWVRNMECPYEITQCDPTWYWWIEHNKIECTRRCEFWSSFVNCTFEEVEYVWREEPWSTCQEDLWWLREYWYGQVVRWVSCYEKKWDTEILTSDDKCIADDKPLDSFYCRISSWKCIDWAVDWVTCLESEW